MSVSAPLLLLDDNETLVDFPALERGSARPVNVQDGLNTEVKEGLTRLYQSGFRVRCSP